MARLMQRGTRCARDDAVEPCSANAGTNVALRLKPHPPPVHASNSCSLSDICAGQPPCCPARWTNIGTRAPVALQAGNSRSVAREAMQNPRDNANQTSVGQRQVPQAARADAVKDGSGFELGQCSQSARLPHARMALGEERLPWREENFCAVIPADPEIDPVGQ